MNSKITIKPDKNGKYFIKLYGQVYEIILEDKTPKEKPKNDKE